MVKSVKRCVNCGLSLKRNWSHFFESNEVQSVIKQWITPRSVAVSDEICHACYVLAREALLQPDTSRSIPRVGHTHVCFNCGRSLRRLLTITLTRTSELDRAICDIFSEWNYPLELKPGSAVCNPCWRRAKRAHLRACGQSASVEENSSHGPEASQDTRNQTEYPITPSLVSQCNEDISGEMEEAPLINDDASENIMECCDTSTTESVESDEEDLSTFNMHEVERSLQDDEDSKPGIEPPPIKTYASMHYSELHTRRKLDLPGEGHSSASEPNTQILDEMQSGSSVEEHSKNTRILDEMPSGSSVGEHSKNTQILDEMPSGSSVGEHSKESQILDEMQSGSSSVGEHSKNTQILDEMQCGASVGEHSKGYTIIANVYNYLRNEYEWLKTRLNGMKGVKEMSDIFTRTAAATGVSKRIVQLALKEESVKAINADHNYHNKELREVNDNQRVRTVETRRMTIKSRVRSDIGINEQSSSKDMHTNGSVPCRKRRTNSEEDELISDDETTVPPKRRPAGISTSTKPDCEKQLPSPAPIQSSVVMETECKIEPVDEDPPAIDDDPQAIDDDLQAIDVDPPATDVDPPATDDDPHAIFDDPHEIDDNDTPAVYNDALEAESWFRYHCEQASTTAATQTVFKIEPTEDDNVQKQDPLESAAPDTTRLEVKLECVDENMEMHGDYSICDPTPVYIKQELE